MQTSSGNKYPSGRSSCPRLPGDKSRYASENRGTKQPANSAHAMSTNFYHDELNLPKATVLGMAQEVSETLVDTINEEKTLNTESSTRLRGKVRMRPYTGNC